jgi:4-amino-4-deoxy-L-arabinose transferase-like glycosyltransferase
MPIYRPIGEFCCLPAGATHRTLVYSRLLNDRRFHAGLLAVMALLVLFAKLHQGDLGGYDSAVYAHEGKQILATGQWWSVYLNGQPDFDKPPMFVWLEAISMWMLGVSDFAARFPSALLGFGTILLIYFLTCELSDSYWTPVWAMMILLTTHPFMRFAMRAMTDVPFTFFFALALLLYLKGLRRPRLLLGFGLALGAAILLRSFLGLIPLGVVLAHLFVTGRLRLLRSAHFQAGVALAIGLPLIWFLSQYQLFGSRFLAQHFSFTYDNLPLTNGKRAGQAVAGLLEYPRLLLGAYWPWLPLMAIGLVAQAKKMIGRRDATASLLVIWVAATIVPFSFAEFKWLRYLMPAFPAFALLAAFTLDAYLTARRRAWFLRAAYAALLLAMGGMWINPKYRDRPEEIRRLAPIAESATHPDQKILLYTKRHPRDAHLFQLIWYADRYCDLLSDFNEVVSRLERNPDAVAITDKQAFEQIRRAGGRDIRVLGETESFICWMKPGTGGETKARNRVKPDAQTGVTNGTF